MRGKKMIPWISFVIPLLLFGCGASPSSNGEASNDPQKGEDKAIRFYVGSSDRQLDHSIFLCELDLKSASIAVIDSFAGASGPSYLAFSPGRDFLYSIDKTVPDPQKKEMSMASFRVDRETDQLEFMNRQPSKGNGPCHVYCSPDGKHIFTSNYSSGNVAAFPIDGDGTILPASSVVQSEGTGPVTNRQQGPHTHQVMLDPSGKYLLSPDLGSDRIMVYAFDRNGGILTPNPNQPFLQLDPGSGPRHLVFHPSGEFLFVVNELNSTVTACSYDPGTGILKQLQTISTVEESHTGIKFPAAIRIHPSGKFLYASTRGDNSSIALFSVGDGGSIDRIQVMEQVPGWPRDFNLTPDGKFLIAAGERADYLEVYSINQTTGRLSSMDIRQDLPAPGCILFIES